VAGLLRASLKPQPRAPQPFFSSSPPSFQHLATNIQTQSIPTALGFFLSIQKELLRPFLLHQIWLLRPVIQLNLSGAIAPIDFLSLSFPYPRTKSLDSLRIVVIQIEREEGRFKSRQPGL
jgi:hypothetical protein